MVSPTVANATAGDIFCYFYIGGCKYAYITL